MKRLFLAATATGLLTALNASATLVADYNPSGIYVNRARAPFPDTLNGDTWNYSDTSPLFNDATGQSGKIYGGLITAWSVAQAYNPWVLTNESNPGFVAHVVPPDVTGTQSVTGAYLWNKADFLEGASEIIQFNAGNSITFDFGMTGGNQQLRLIVKQGGVTYISEWWTAGFDNISHDPSTTNWAVLDTTNYTWGAFSPLTLDNIEGAGVYYTLSVTGGQCLARLFDFQVDATVVPAPGTNELVVDFDSSSVDVGGRAVSTTTLNGATWDYSDTTPLLNDADPTGKNGKFYGGVSTAWSVAQEHTPPMYKNIDEGFTVQVIPPDVTGTQSLKAVYLWNKADFLAGSSDIVQFNAGHYISYNFSWVTATGNQNFRLVVKQDGIVYISEWNTSSYGNGGNNVTQNITTTNWAVLNTTDYTWGTFSPVTFDDVEGAGIYYQVSRTNEQTAARMIDFQVMARVITNATGDNYTSWAASQVPPVTGGENGDDDNDGVSNLVEYSLVNGGERGVLSGNTITFTKRGAPYGGDLTYIIETSETLSDPWLPVVTHGPDQLGSPISYDLAPAPGTPKKFARLKVVKAP